MLVELQEIVVRSRAQEPALAAFEAAMPARAALSPVGGVWRSEVGTLNQIIIALPYADDTERRRVQREAARLPDWSASLGDRVISRRRRILQAAAFSPPLAPAQYGRCYEFRTYTYPRGAIPLVVENWNNLLPPRAAMSPFIGAWHRETARHAEWIHVWAYRDAGDRERVREAAREAGIWPTSVVEKRLGIEPQVVALTMQNMLAVPAAFSPLR